MTAKKCLCGATLNENEGVTWCPSEDGIQPQEAGENSQARTRTPWDIAHDFAHKDNVKEWYK